MGFNVRPTQIQDYFVFPYLNLLLFIYMTIAGEAGNK